VFGASGHQSLVDASLGEWTVICVHIGTYFTDFWSVDEDMICITAIGTRKETSEYTCETLKN